MIRIALREPLRGGDLSEHFVWKPFALTVPPSWGVAWRVGWDESPAAAGKDAPDYDLCQVTVADTNMFCLESLQTKEYPEGIPRWKCHNSQEHQCLAARLMPWIVQIAASKEF